MNKPKDWINRGKEIINRARKGKLTSEDKTNIVTVSLALLSISALIVLISKFWLPIAATAVIAYIVYEEVKSKRPTPQPQPNNVDIAYNALFGVLQDIHERINARKAIDLMDIAVMPPITQKGGVPMVRAKLVRTHQHPLTEDDLEIVKKRLQGRMNEHLRQRKIMGVPYISPDGHAPTIFIDSVSDNVINYLVDMVVIDNPDKLHYYYKSHGTNRHVRPKGDDKDF